MPIPKDKFFQEQSSQVIKFSKSGKFYSHFESLLAVRFHCTFLLCKKNKNNSLQRWSWKEHIHALFFFIQLIWAYSIHIYFDLRSSLVQNQNQSIVEAKRSQSLISIQHHPGKSGQSRPHADLSSIYTLLKIKVAKGMPQNHFVF